MDPVTFCDTPTPLSANSRTRVRSAARRTRGQRGSTLGAEVDTAHLFLAHAASAEPRTVTRQLSSRRIATFTTHHRGSCAHASMRRRRSQHRQHTPGSPLEGQSTGDGGGGGGDDIVSPRRTPNVITPSSTFESVWGKAPGLPTFPKCNVSVSGRPAAATLSSAAGSADEENTTTTAAAAATRGMVAVSISGSGTSPASFAPIATILSSSVARPTSTVSQCSSQPQVLSYAADGSLVLPSPTAPIVSSFNVSSGEYSVSGDGGRRFQNSGGSSGQDAAPHRSWLPEVQSSRRSHALSLESSAASSLGTPVGQPDEQPRVASTGRAASTHRMHSPPRQPKRHKRLLSVFMIIDDASADELTVPEVHNPLRLPARSRQHIGTGTSSGFSQSHSHRRCVVSVDDGPSSIAFANTTFNLDDTFLMGTPRSETSILTNGGQLRSRLTPATIATTTTTTTTTLHGQVLSLPAAPLSPRVAPSERFSLCSQLVLGVGGCAGARRSQSCMSAFVRSASSDWNTSPAVSAGPVSCGPGRPRRPRWQTSSRVATAGFGAGSTADAGMDESAFPIINFDFDHVDE